MAKHLLYSIECGVQNFPAILRIKVKGINIIHRNIREYVQKEESHRKAVQNLPKIFKLGP